MKTPTKFLLAIYIFSAQISFTQNTFEKKIYTYNPNFANDITSVIKAIDSGYLITGRMDYPSGGFISSPYILKINEFGDTLFTRRYENSNGYSSDLKLKQIYDSSYIVCDITQANNTCDPLDFYLMKLKPNLDTVWTKHYGTCHPEQRTDVCKGPNGGYYVTSSMVQYSSYFWGGMVMRVNSVGDTIWTKQFQISPDTSFTGSNTHEAAIHCIPTIDGGVITDGYIADITNVLPYISVLTKFDSLGNVSWTKKYENLNIFDISNQNNSYLIISGGNPHLDGVGPVIINIDNNGDINWAKQYIDTTAVYAPSTAIKQNNGNLYILGTKEIGFPTTNQDAYRPQIMLTDSVGNLIIAKEYNFNMAGGGAPRCVANTRDNGVLIGGVARYLSTDTYYKGLLIKTDSTFGTCHDSIPNITQYDVTNYIISYDTLVPHFYHIPVTVKSMGFIYNNTGLNYSDICSGNVGVDELGMRNEELEIYPNPSNGEVTIKLNKEYKNIRIEITDVIGQTVYKEELKNTNQISLSLNQPPGLYFVSVTTEKGRVNKKIVIE